MRMMSVLCLLAAALVCARTAHAEAPLFASDTVMKLTIPVDFRDLCRPRETEDCDFTPTVIIFGDEKGGSRRIPVDVKIRGGWRSLSRNCSVPLLWLRFAEADVLDTPFEGQSLLPLTTHCGRGLSVAAVTRATAHGAHEQYLLLEFLAHRIYGILSDYSLRSRLVRISYPDPDRPRASLLHYAFITEHFDDLAARTGTTRVPRGGFDHRRLDAQSAARLALFQFMIGNTDWSIVRERNTMLLQTAAGNQIPVPYDLDMSGLVNADYAGPAPGLPIDDVRERYFLGFCQPGIDWDILFARFEDASSEILALSDRLPGLSAGSRRWVKRYLGGFYEILSSAEQRSRQVSGACQPWPPSAVDHTTPLDGTE